MLTVFTDEEERYLIKTELGPDICRESQTPPDILAMLKRKNQEYHEMVGGNLIVFEN